MKVDILITLEIENPDSGSEAIEAAKDQLRNLDIEEILDLADYTWSGR